MTAQPIVSPGTQKRDRLERPVADSADELVATAPFDMTLPISDITP